MVREMLPPAEFSPDAYLTQPLAIGEVAEMHLTTTAWLPPAPNVCIINDAGKYEIVRYESMDATSLYTLTRGVSLNGALGAPVAHDAGVAVYRGDCALDDIAFAENIRYLMEKQVIGVRWDRGAGGTNHTELVLIDDKGNAIPSLPFDSFDNHMLWGNIRRVTVSANGAVTRGTNARGDTLTLDGSAGRVMVEIPKFWVKAERTATGVYSWWVSSVPQSGFEVHPAFRQRGGVERDFIYVGAYEAALAYRDYPAHASTVLALHSFSGAQPATGQGTIRTLAFTSGGASAPTVGETLTGATSAVTAVLVDYNLTSGTWAGGDAAGTLILRQVSGTFGSENLNGSASGANCMTVGGAAVGLYLDEDDARGYADAIGPGWGLENIWTNRAWRLLMAIEYQTWDLQTALGRGVVDLAAGTGYAGRLTGYGGADAAIATNGTGKGAGVDGEAAIVWRGIENPWGNVSTYVDGLQADAYANAYIVPREGTVALTTGDARPFELPASKLPGGDGHVSDLLFEGLTRLLLLPGSVTGGSASTYCCDRFLAPAAVSGAAVGGSWASGDDAGLMAMDCDLPASVGERTLGARLEFIGPEPMSAGSVLVSTAHDDATLFPPPVTGTATPTAPYAAWSDASSGTIAWDAPQKVLHQDGGYCRAAAGAGETNLLKVQGFRFNIPGTATITGIQVIVYCKATAKDVGTNVVDDAVLKLIKADGSLSASNFADAGNWWEVTAEPMSHGGTNSKWGETWTPADINSGEFGVALAVTQAGTAIAMVDFIGVRVYYSV